MARATSAEDNDLCRQIAAGDEQAFERLFIRWYARLVVFAESFSINRPQAEEIVSEAFVKYWQSRSNFEALAQVKTWLYTVVRNGSLMALRQQRQGIQMEDTDEELLATDDFSEVQQVRSELLALIEEQIGQLPDKYQQVVVLTYREGLSSAQIAERLGISVTNVTSRRSRAIEMLRIALSNRFPAFATLALKIIFANL